MPDRPPYMPVEAKPWRLRMGLRPLEPRRWLEVDGSRAAELTLKGDLLDSVDTRARVLALGEGHEKPAGILLQLVLDDLVANHPGLLTFVGGGRVREESTGQCIDTAGMPAIEAAARLVQEDLCLMVEAAGGGWFLGAACVCFPSRWALSEKIGRNLGAIHAPVPGYDSELAAPTDSFFDRLSPDRPVWRLNWTLLTEPDLHLPDPAARARFGPGRIEPPGGIWFRVERQTLRAIAPGAVAFTIRTYVAPLEDLISAYPEAGPALTVALSGAPPEVLEYKGWAELAPRVVDWLSGAGPKGD